METSCGRIVKANFILPVNCKFF